MFSFASWSREPNRRLDLLHALTACILSIYRRQAAGAVSLAILQRLFIQHLRHDDPFMQLAEAPRHVGVDGTRDVLDSPRPIPCHFVSPGLEELQHLVRFVGVDVAVVLLRLALLDAHDRLFHALQHVIVPWRGDATLFDSPQALHLQATCQRRRPVRRLHTQRPGGYSIQARQRLLHLLVHVRHVLVPHEVLHGARRVLAQPSLQLQCGSHRLRSLVQLLDFTAEGVANGGAACELAHAPLEVTGNVSCPQHGATVAGALLGSAMALVLFVMAYPD